MRQGCEAIQNACISSAIVVLEDGTVQVAHPTFVLEVVTPELITAIIRERLMQDDFATRPIRSAIRARLRELEDKSPREQLKALAQLLQEHAEHFLIAAGTGMDEAMQRREAELDAQCEKRAA